MSMLIFTGSKHFVGEMSNLGLKEAAGKDKLNIEVLTENRELIANMNYELMTKDDFLREVNWTGCNVRKVIKVTDFELQGDIKNIEEFLNSIYEIFIEALNLINWGVIYIQLSFDTFKTIKSLEDKLLDCSHKFTVNNNGDNSLLLFL